MADDSLDPLLNPQQLHDFAVSAYRTKYGNDPTDQQLQGLGNAVGYTQGTSLRRSQATSLLNSPQAAAGVTGSPYGNDARTDPLPATPAAPTPAPTAPPSGYAPYGNDTRTQQVPSPGGVGTGSGDLLTPQQLHDFAVQAYRTRFGSDPTDAQLRALGTATGYTQGTSLSLADATRLINTPQAYNAVYNLRSQPPPNGGYVAPPTPPPSPRPTPAPTPGPYGTGQPSPRMIDDPTGDAPPPQTTTDDPTLPWNLTANTGVRNRFSRQEVGEPEPPPGTDLPTDPQPPPTEPPQQPPVVPPPTDQNPFPMTPYKLANSNPTAVGRPSTATDPNALTAYIQQWAQQHPGANPSVARDPGYWANAIARTHGSGAIDWGYWENRFNTPEGAPEGPTPTTTTGGPGPQPPPTGTVPPPTGFADPAYQGLIDLVNQRLNNLNQPRSFPQLDQYMQMLQEQEGRTRQRAQDFASQLQTRIGQLQQPLLTDANVANQRALASNSLLAQRDATLKNQRERRFASGFEPTSGLIAGDERSTNENYNNRQAQIDAMLAQQQIQGDEQRRNTATNLQGLATQALQGGDVSALTNAATLTDLENQQFNMEQNRQRELLTTGQIPVDLTNMGFNNANQVANGGGDPLNSILQLIQSANGQQQLQQNNSNSNWGALALLLQQLGR